MAWKFYDSNGNSLQLTGSHTLASHTGTVDSADIANGSIDLVHMSADSVDSNQYVDASIDLAHMSVNSIDSDQYVDGSIDNVHLADDAVGADELAANAVVNASVASGAQITFDKMVNLTTSRALVTDGSGDIIVSGVTTTELELLDGLTSSTAELNLLDGVSGLVQADLTKLAAVDSTATELNLLDALDRGSILYGNASGVTTVLGQGGADTVLTSDGDDIAWQAAGSGAVARKGGNTGEASTTSTGAVEILQATSLSIAATAPFQGFAALQKTTGHASTSNTGWYLNGSRVSETIWSSGANGLEAAGWYLKDVARLGNPYEGAGMLWTFSGDGGDVPHHPGAIAFEPTGTTDTIGVLGRVANASNTFKADELQVYDYSLS